MTTLNTRLYSTVRSAENLQAEIMESLGRRQEIRWLDLDSLTVGVQHGVVTLSGYLNKESNFNLIDRIVGSIPGVIQIDNQLVIDRDLTLRVAQALAGDVRMKSIILPVGTTHGWVRFGGEVPTRELQAVVEEVTAGVPGVRGIVSLPKLPNEKHYLERRAVQPSISAKVFGDNGQLGAVTQVVIQPRSRLVTHIVMESEGFESGSFFRREYLVSVDSIYRVNEESVFLKRKNPSLSVISAFDPSAYPLAPLDWKPPYPYRNGTVRWSLEKQETVVDESSRSAAFQMQTVAARL